MQFKNWDFSNTVIDFHPKRTNESRSHPKIEIDPA